MTVKETHTKTFKVVSKHDSGLAEVILKGKPGVTTKDKIYTIISIIRRGINGDQSVTSTFIGDNGQEYSYYVENFYPLPEYRLKQLDKIL